MGEALVRAQRGDRPAFTELVRAHQDMVYSLLLHMLSERAVAEEIAQDVFLEMHRHLHEFESPEHLSRWLRTVAGRRAIDEVRRRRFRSRKTIDELPEPRTEARTDDLLLNGRVRALLDRLPARHRAVVVLRYQEDLDPADIAGQLQMPVSTVKSTLHRALRMLRARLSQPVAGARRGIV